MLLGKRERPVSEQETVIRLNSVYDKIRNKYKETLNQIHEETKDDPIIMVQNWCGFVIRLASKEFPKASQKHLLDAIRDVVEIEKSFIQPQD